MNALRAMAALKAARDFGLHQERAARLAVEAAHDLDHLVDRLASALVEDGALRVPDAA